MLKIYLQHKLNSYHNNATHLFSSCRFHHHDYNHHCIHLHHHNPHLLCCDLHHQEHHLKWATWKTICSNISNHLTSRWHGTGCINAFINAQKYFLKLLLFYLPIISDINGSKAMQSIVLLSLSTCLLLSPSKKGELPQKIKTLKENRNISR